MARDIGIIGIGTMGAALALNIAENGFGVAAFDRDSAAVQGLADGAGKLAGLITGCADLAEFVAALARPRNIILLVPAGAIVDAVIADLRPHLDADDLIIDMGNANFRNTITRAEALPEAGLRFLGVGVSGGAAGARRGPSIMAGGDPLAWDRVAPIFTAIAAQYDGTACATYMGPGGAGHFVKTVHNGIEYADMQMIAEAYGLMRDGLGMAAAEIGAVFDRWNGGKLASYLIEISGKVAAAIDPDTGTPMLDVILDRAGQKGTGRWTAIEALKLGAPATTIEAAVAARGLSSRLPERARGEALFGRAAGSDFGALGTDDLLADLESALLAGKIACYAQGFGLLAAASEEFEWALPLADVARVWRAGCIIRSDMLDDMAAALAAAPGQNLMFAPDFAAHLKAHHTGLRRVVAAAALSGNPAPALSSALSYFDTMRTERGTANMIQGQRDFFGAHSFGRLDRAGNHHGPWAQD